MQSQIHQSSRTEHNTNVIASNDATDGSNVILHNDRNAIEAYSLHHHYHQHEQSVEIEVANRLSDGNNVVGGMTSNDDGVLYSLTHSHDHTHSPTYDIDDVVTTTEDFKSNLSSASSTVQKFPSNSEVISESSNTYQNTKSQSLTKIINPQLTQHVSSMLVTPNALSPNSAVNRFRSNDSYKTSFNRIIKDGNSPSHNTDKMYVETALNKVSEFPDIIPYQIDDSILKQNSEVLVNGRNIKENHTSSSQLHIKKILPKATSDSKFQPINMHRSSKSNNSRASLVKYELKHLEPTTRTERILSPESISSDISISDVLFSQSPDSIKTNSAVDESHIYQNHEKANNNDDHDLNSINGQHMFDVSSRPVSAVEYGDNRRLNSSHDTEDDWKVNIVENYNVSQSMNSEEHDYSVDNYDPVLAFEFSKSCSSLSLYSSSAASKHISNSDYGNEHRTSLMSCVSKSSIFESDCDHDYDNSSNRYSNDTDVNNLIFR